VKAQTVVVTGASAGVGRALARAYGQRGDRVALLARGTEGLQAAAEDVQDAGGTALPLEVDVADANAVENAAARIEQELGAIDIWVNNAFSAVFAPFSSMSMDEVRRTTEVTYLGYVYGTSAALRRMRMRDRGTIVQVGSALAYRGIPLQSAYCGAKHAIQGFTESLRCELLHERSNVHVTMVQLPAVNTPQFSWVRSRLRRSPQPVPPIYQPELVADAILYAGDHPKRREYWVGTSTALTIIANAVAPGALDRYLARTGYNSQLTDAAKGEGQHVRVKLGPDGTTTATAPNGNLWSAADSAADFGSHGRFDAKAHGSDPQIWFSQHHGAILAGVGTVLFARHRLRN
jgi:NAD(P)-dependent dehydrogenase (short-subunit alcohol dehydrogenase family)